VIATVALGLGGTLLTSPAVAAPGPDRSAPRATTVWVDQFDGPLAWTVRDAPGRSDARSDYRAFNVWVHDSMLQLTTRRHCVATADTAPTQDNVSSAPCGNLVTKYTSGRVERDLGLPRGADFQLSFSAAMPKTPATGTRQALWMNNDTGAAAGPGGTYCDSSAPWKKRKRIGELDTIEWYGKRPARSTHTTHLSCNGAKTRRTTGAADIPAPASFHVWSVKRVGRTITYFRGDGVDPLQRVARHTCGKGAFAKVSNKRCSKIFNQPFHAIMEGEVFKKGSPYGSPKGTKRFPAQRLLIDWVSVVRLD